MLRLPHDFLNYAAKVDSNNQRHRTLFFRHDELLVNAAADAFGDIGSDNDGQQHIEVGLLGGCVYSVTQVSAETQPPPGTKFTSLRSLFSVMPESLVAIAGRGLQLLNWDRTHRYCGACATATQRSPNENARRCTGCGLSAYPRISPAMMCLVTHQSKILLARNVNFPPGRFSALAGFVEAGECVEDALHREVREEVGIEVENLSYFGSQSWPFPNSLMIAYTAEYKSGELKPNGVEIAEAQWFDIEDLPQLPPQVSIARALIEDTVKRFKTGT